MNACEAFGHSWGITVKHGHLIEACSACGLTPAEAGEEN